MNSAGVSNLEDAVLDRFRSGAPQHRYRNKEAQDQERHNKASGSNAASSSIHSHAQRADAFYETQIVEAGRI